jgi:hypothetical protein
VTTVNSLAMAIAVLCSGVGAWLTMAGFVVAAFRPINPLFPRLPQVPFGVAVSTIGLLMFGAGSIGCARFLLL